MSKPVFTSFSKNAKLVAVSSLLTLFSVAVQAQAASQLSQGVCKFKNYFFDGALVGAILTVSIIIAAVFAMVDDNNKFKGQVLGLLFLGLFVLSVPQILGALGFISC